MVTGDVQSQQTQPLVTEDIDQEQTEPLVTDLSNQLHGSMSNSASRFTTDCFVLLTGPVVLPSLTAAAANGAGA